MLNTKKRRERETLDMKRPSASQAESHAQCQHELKLVFAVCMRMTTRHNSEPTEGHVIDTIGVVQVLENAPIHADLARLH